MRTYLFSLSVIFLLLFTYFSYTVAKERWTQFDFDNMVKIQDRVPQRFDDNFSIFSLLGSAEITVGFCLVMALFALSRLRWKQILGWSMIVPATLIEVFGKLVIFHPGPPLFFHRTTLATHLPSFYVHTEFSYPSGHMTRTIFIITILICVLVFSKINLFLRYGLIIFLLSLGFLMSLTRISLGEHWFTDVFGGILLGIGFGLFASVLILTKKKV